MAASGLSCGMHTLSCGMQNLFPWPGIKPRFPALGVRNLSHWTTRELPGGDVFESGLNWMVWSEVRWQWVKKWRPQLLGLFSRCLTERSRECQERLSPQKVNLDVFIGWGQWTNRTQESEFIKEGEYGWNKMPKGKGDHEYKAGTGVGRSVHVCTHAQRQVGIILNSRWNIYFPETWKRVKVISFFNIYFCLFYLAAPGLSCSMQDLVSWPGIEPWTSCIGSEES